MKDLHVWSAGVLVAVAAASALGGCSTLTDRSIVYSAGVYRDPAVSVELEGEALDPEQGEDLIEDAADGDAYTENLKKLLAVEEALTGNPLVAGNTVELLIDGPDAYREMFAAIETAKHHIHLETFIFADDEIGQSLAELLAKKRGAGVEVRVIYDSYGSLSTSGKFLDRLREAGIELHEFHPINPLKEAPWNFDNRDHRKILVVDGRIGFTGGMNVSGVYSSSSFSPPEPDEKPILDSRWRDTHVRIDGPAVAELQKLFLRLWTEENGDDAPKGPTEKYFPALDARGEDLVRVIANEGGDDEYEIYEAYLAAIEHARRCVWITQAYFAPNEDLLDALEDAAERGVDVRVLVPGVSTTQVVLNASRSHYGELLEKGVRIFERDDAMVHAKTAVVDGVWSTVGSSNFDYLSFLHNHEANAVIVSRKFGRQMENLFRRDMRHAREIDRDEWAKRPIFWRMVEHLSSLFTYWI